MKDKIKKWWNRDWSNWEVIKEDFIWADFKNYIVLKRVSNHGLKQYKKIIKL
jgi:hypothetical protein